MNSFINQPRFSEIFPLLQQYAGITTGTTPMVQPIKNLLKNAVEAFWSAEQFKKKQDFIYISLADIYFLAANLAPILKPEMTVQEVIIELLFDDKSGLIVSPILTTPSATEIDVKWLTGNGAIIMTKKRFEAGEKVEAEKVEEPAVEEVKVDLPVDLPAAEEEEEIAEGPIDVVEEAIEAHVEVEEAVEVEAKEVIEEDKDIEVEDDKDKDDEEEDDTE